MSVSPTIEEYLESIYLMSAAGKPAVGARLAEALKVSAPTVTETVRRMQRDGYVGLDSAKGITLTERGQELAEQLVRRHALSERLLTDLLGVDWHTAHAEACRLEHAISPEVEERLAAVLGNPVTCPHGNPIPGATGAEDPIAGERPLSETRPGQTVLVHRVSEEAEADAELLAHFDRWGLRPGTLLQVAEVLSVNGTVTVLINGETVTLGLRAADQLWVCGEGSGVESRESSSQ